MLGRVLNTNQQWLCRRLTDLGYILSRQVAVADTGRDIQHSLREALSRADLVITTGGLGPTSDDLTRDLVARLLDRKLREDAATLTQIRRFFRARKRTMPDSVRVQALVPEGAIVLPNPNGTAPGLAIEVCPNSFRRGGKSSWLVMLPGPPRELRPMFDECVVEILNQKLPSSLAFVCRTLRSTGVPESIVEERISKPLRSLVRGGLEVGYCARVGQVDVRLSARGSKGEVLVDAAERIVREHLGESIYGTDDDELENAIVRLLMERRQTLAIAESCTGGSLSNRITNVPGSSTVFLAGLVTYSNDAKRDFLGVAKDTLVRDGAVSEPVARAMAEGARRRTGADYALSVTGIAGPGGGTARKPVGTVFIGIAGPDGTSVERHFNPYDRETFKQATAQQALNRLRLSLLARPSAWASQVLLR